jgi:putative phage-type endonuclease
MKIVDCIQGSPEWFAARIGKVSASRVADLIAKTKTGIAASRANYAAELVAERLTGVTAEKYSNAAMAWGTETEPQARSMYEFMRDCDVVEVGTVLHPTIDMACASPDGLVGEDGLIEIKCPNTSTHIETLLGDSIAGKYITQMQWQMACTGRKWCDFVSFDPRMPGDMQLLVRRVPRDGVRIVELEREVVRFLSEVDESIAELVALYRKSEAA